MSKSTEELLLNSVESASRRKIKIPDLLKEQDSQNVNIIVELDLLSSLMKNLLCCKYCCSSEKIELREDLKSRRGLAVSLEIICHNCEESTSTMSSKISNKCYDVNLRLTYGMRAIGKGGAAARIFCGLMNLPPPPAKFERHNSLFLNVLKTISEDSMNAAVHEAVIANDNNSNIAVAVDGTWHKRGYSSLNGVVCATSVENGKRKPGFEPVTSRTAVERLTTELYPRVRRELPGLNRGPLDLQPNALPLSYTPRQKGTPWFEPGTSRLAVECSTTE
ncbi:uncharacterized protein TNCV_1211811, partial [Trichonephila clavipes]